jgi:integrase
VFAAIGIDHITSGDMCRYQEQRLALGAAAATVNKDLGALGRMFTLAIREGWIQSKPHFQRLQEADPRQGFVKHDQYLAIRQHLPAVYQDALDFANYSGWRKGEITGLTWAMIDFQSGTVRLPPLQ